MHTFTLVIRNSNSSVQTVIEYPLLFPIVLFFTHPWTSKWDPNALSMFKHL